MKYLNPDTLSILNLQEPIYRDKVLHLMPLLDNILIHHNSLMNTDQKVFNMPITKILKVI